MPKTLKIIIVTILILATILVIFIAPKVIPYTPPSPNIVKTDQGSFELRITNNNGFYAKNNNYSYATYKEYENYAKDYYYRISKFINEPNLILNFNASSPGDGPILPSINLSINLQNKELFNAIYTHNTNYNFLNNRYNFKTFVDYSDSGDQQSISLEKLLQTPKYQNIKLN